MMDGYGPRFILVCMTLATMIGGGGGLLSPGLFGTYQTPGRCIFTLICSALSFVVAYRCPYWILRIYCAFWAIILGALAGAGHALGVPGVRVIGPKIADPELYVLLKDQVELGSNDHRIHLILAGLFLLAAILPKSWDSMADKPTDS